MGRLTAVAELRVSLDEMDALVEVEVTSFDTPMLLGGSRSVEDNVEFLLATGIATARRAPIDAATEVLASHYDEDRVGLGAGIG